MALSDTDKADIRYYMGYAAAGDATYYAFRDLAYSDVSYMSVALDDNQGGGKLNHLTAVEEARITGFFLPQIRLRETEIQTAAANLDTAQAAVWTRNANEVGDRTALFNSLRRDLCHFLGFPPGTGLSSGGRLSRS